MYTECAVFTVCGKIRKNNQDNIFFNGFIKDKNVSDYKRKEKFDEQEQYFAVCDGMGGEQNGEIASYVAVETMLEEKKNGNPVDLGCLIQEANENVCALQREKNIYCGTTFVGVRLKQEGCSIANVGDSRAYYISKGQIRQMSKDHTEYQMYVDSGLVNEKIMFKPSAHHTLTQHLGISSDIMMLEPYEMSLPQLCVGDLFLLCSDGLHGVMGEDEIMAIMNHGNDLLDCCKRLVMSAEECGSRDNITVMLIRVDGLES